MVHITIFLNILTLCLYSVIHKPFCDSSFLLESFLNFLNNSIDKSRDSAKNSWFDNLTVIFQLVDITSVKSIF